MQSGVISMSIKKFFSALGLLILLSLALTLNFILQQDYFNQIGFAGIVVFISIILLDTSKVLSETMFFRIKHCIAKYILAVFSIVLLIISAYTTFSVRQHKTYMAHTSIEKDNQSITEKNTSIKQQKQRLQDQISSIDGQIKTKQSLITSLQDDEKGKWLRHRYNKEIDKLDIQKSPLLKEINKLDKQIIPIDKKKVSLQTALALSIGIKAMKIETITNLTIALTIEGIIIFLCYSLSFVLRTNRTKSESKKDKIVREDVRDTENHQNNPNNYRTFHRTKPANKVQDKENTIQFYNDEDIKNDFPDSERLKGYRASNNLTQIELAEKWNISRSKIAKMETGAEKVSQDVLELIGRNGN